MTLDVVTRAEWEAQPPAVDLEPLEHPVEHVIYTHSLDIDKCHSDDECKTRMQELQKKHLDSGAPDILYNFVIGGNGKAYEGRGWWKQSDKSLIFPEHHGKRIDIAYMGNYGAGPPSIEMCEKAVEVVAYGISEDYIYREFFEEWC